MSEWQERGEWGCRRRKGEAGALTALACMYAKKCPQSQTHMGAYDVHDLSMEVMFSWTAWTREGGGRMNDSDQLQGSQQARSWSWHTVAISRWFVT